MVQLFFYNYSCNENLHIICQDTAGEERYRGLSHFYCRNAGAAILAFDITDEDSFHALRFLLITVILFHDDVRHFNAY